MSSDHPPAGWLSLGGVLEPGSRVAPEILAEVAGANLDKSVAVDGLASGPHEAAE